ncbi:Vta1 like-domain-containing protein [Aspergillus transmontanensis]|uniref:Vta1 like-domain-containing protein n=1 Tax=Aspergillus transmontanensis TaxID=1034304 RepID=A0A5N6VH38_9EURO|nr:Vta1 like-domain-containing protein [Aspergillus transmontanensis]
MATNIPAALKSADIGRFAVRAAQLERVKPVVAYWCNFWIVNQIIEKGLHTSDDEVKLYTTELVDKLEKFKNENPDNETVTDAVAANAYVEQFGLEIFGRAEATMRANKVTKQTADTFQAAATFLELCQIWNHLEPETAAKIKFAKYHAVRIAKAIRAGEDPNESNPVMKDEDEIAGDSLDVQKDDPEVQAIVGSLPTQSRQPSVEDVPEDSTYPSGPSPSLPQPPTGFTEVPTASHDAARSPTQDMDIDAEQGAPLNLPSAPATLTSSSTSVPNLPDTPTSVGTHQSPGASDSFQSFPPPSTVPPSSPPAASRDPSSFYSQPRATPHHQPARSPAAAPVMPRPTPQPVHTPTTITPTASSSGYVNSQAVDDNSIALAQKHARWAVSALTFDDVNTAIKELKNSLKCLGAE